MTLLRCLPCLRGERHRCQSCVLSAGGRPAPFASGRATGNSGRGDGLLHLNIAIPIVAFPEIPCSLKVHRCRVREGGAPGWRWERGGSGRNWGDTAWAAGTAVCGHRLHSETGALPGRRGPAVSSQEGAFPLLVSFFAILSNCTYF